MQRIEMKDNKVHKYLSNGILFTVSLLVGLFICEVALRILPIPGIQLDYSVYDELVGGSYYPGVTVNYRNDRGDVAERKVNQWGFLDKEYTADKGGQKYRIGFFGDSYTEAKQVPLEDTFFRLIEDNLKQDSIETLAFGHSGFGTLQSYLNYSRLGELFDLDLVVYVFVENDLGDQIKEIKRIPTIPYPILTDSGFKVDNSFREINSNRRTWYYKVGNFLTANSLVFSTVSSRLSLLMRYGIKFDVTTEDRLMAGRQLNQAGNDKTTDQGDQPSTWPKELRLEAEKTFEAVLLKWLQETRSRSKDFVILYVPRGSDLSGRTMVKNSWKPWLENLAGRHGIAFIDPSAELQSKSLEGKEVFYDHLTTDGHIAVARAFLQWFKKLQSKDHSL